MNEEVKPQVRLYAILAREAPIAVVFRRGPSKRVLLVLWQTDSDCFYEGQWLKGRIYERRCDLSPKGEVSDGGEAVGFCPSSDRLVAKHDVPIVKGARISALQH